MQHGRSGFPTERFTQPPVNTPAIIAVEAVRNNVSNYRVSIHVTDVIANGCSRTRYNVLAEQDGCRRWPRLRYCQRSFT